MHTCLLAVQDPWRQKREIHALDLELQAVVSHWVWVLGAECRVQGWARATGALRAQWTPQHGLWVFLREE